VLDEKGVLFGGTSEGGHHQHGTVYALSRDKGVWTATIIYEPGFREGYPTAVELGPGGVVYFATAGARVRNAGGTISSLTPPASSGGTWTVTGIYDFPSHRNYAGEGAGPNGLRLQKKTGILFGTAGGGGRYRFGTLYESIPPASAGGRWEFHKLFDFNYTDGESPNSGFAEDSDGVLYGVTNNTVFSLIP
jgi:hypothetical protein